MKTKGALLYEPNTDWKVEEIEVGDPVAGEVQVRLAATGLCHDCFEALEAMEPALQTRMGESPCKAGF